MMKMNIRNARLCLSDQFMSLFSIVDFKFGEDKWCESYLIKTWLVKRESKHSGYINPSSHANIPAVS